MHTCINPKHLEAAVNMINGHRRDKRRRPAHPVLHGGSQSHRVDWLHTLHGDSITSCSLDAALEESLLLKQTLCAFTSATLLDEAGTSGGITLPLSAEASPRRKRICTVCVFKWLQIRPDCNDFRRGQNLLFTSKQYRYFILKISVLTDINPISAHYGRYILWLLVVVVEVWTTVTCLCLAEAREQIHCALYTVCFYQRF